MQCYKILLLIHLVFTLTTLWHFTTCALQKMYSIKHQCSGCDKVLKKYHPKCLSVCDVWHVDSKTLQSESILKLTRILCFWLLRLVSTQEKSKKYIILPHFYKKQTNLASWTDVMNMNRWSACLTWFDWVSWRLKLGEEFRFKTPPKPYMY